MTRAEPQKTVDRPGRRWRYRLRALLLLVLLASIGMSWFAARMHRARRQREAVAAIEKSGGCVIYYHEEGTPFPFSRMPPRGPLWLRRLLGDDFFRTVLEARVTSDADFQHLKQLDQLKRVRFCGPIGESAAFCLEELHLTPEPTLADQDPVCAEWEQIAQLSKLEELYVGATDVGDAELERLKAMAQLRCLDLYGTKITDAGLRHLAGLTRLETLRLDRTQIGDVGVAHLKALKQLKRLGLARTRITDGALEHLTGLNHLAELDLRLTNVTAEGVTKIEQALPRCKVGSSIERAPTRPTVEPDETPITSDPFDSP